MQTHKLSKVGEALVSSFVNYHASMPELHKMTYWFKKAEIAADDSMPWEDPVLEMPAIFSATGRDESITIYKTLFDVEVLSA